jgi:phosphatidylglycerol:prolipoprotein diacylglycerol transferase
VAQIAFKIGPLEVYWFGVLVAVGFLVGLWTASRRCRQDGSLSEAIADLGPWLLLGGIVGARLLHVVSYWREEFASKPWWEMFMIQRAGLVFYGGLGGASLATLFYIRAKGLPLWKLADALAPSIALGQVFGRIGCLVNGCCFGLPTRLPWAIHYPAGHVTQGCGVHPVQLYEAFLDLGLYLALARQYRRRGFDGQVFALYLAGYAALRFGVEFFRGDYEQRYLGGWATPGQLVSAGVLAAGVWLWWRLGRSGGQIQERS